MDKDTHARSGRGARDRILAAAYELFSERGVEGVGIDAVIKRSGVARMTLYRHFASKEKLVLAYLARRERQWTDEWLRHEVLQNTQDPVARLLAVFDVFDEWFHRENYEGCAFVTILLESAGTNGSLRDVCASYLENIRKFIEELAAEAGIVDRKVFAQKWHILMKGAIVAAVEGNRNAAQQAREVGAILLQYTLANAATH